MTQKTQRPLGHSQLYAAWRAAIQHAGLPAMPLRTTRHSAATLLLAADVPARIQIAILGHTRVDLTHGYQHPDLDLLGSTMERVEVYLAGRNRNQDA